jgi:hypothetical protein
MIVTSTYFDNLVQSVLTEHISSGGFTGPLNGLTLVLFTNQMQINKNTTFAQLVEATFSGYARAVALTWGAPIRQGDGTATVLSQLITFVAQAASNFVANTIWGWALIDTASSPNFIMGELFAQPVAIAAPGNGFGLSIEWNLTPVNVNSFGSVLA